MKRILPAVAFVLFTPFAVNAQESATDNGEEEVPDKFAIKIGAFHIYDRDSEAMARSSTGVIGTTIDFEDDLDADETSDATRVRGYYRFDPHHRIDFGWYKVVRDGSRTVDRELSFGDTVFPVNGGVDSSLETEIGKLAYTYSFYHVDKVELGVSLGAYWMSYDIELENSARTLATEESISSPLPVWGMRADYSINPRWHFLFDYEMFYFELEDKIRGSLDDLQIALEYRVARNVSLGAAVNRLGVDVEIDNDDWDGSVSDLMRGYQLYLGLHY